MLVGVTERVVVVGILALALGCGGEKKSEGKPAAGSSTPIASSRAPDPAEKQVELAQPKQEEVSRAAADFDGDALVACSHATVKYDPTLKLGSGSMDGLLMLVEEGLVGSRGGDALLTSGGRKRDLTEMLYLMMVELSPEQLSKITADEQKQLAAERKRMTEKLAEAPKLFKEQGWITVERCEFPNRTPLGICENSAAEKTFGWSLSIYHFDVKSTSDSDSGMKNCLSGGGKWTAATGDDAARERAKQHALDVQKRIDKHAKDLNRTMESLKNATE